MRKTLVIRRVLLLLLLSALPRGATYAGEVVRLSDTKSPTTMAVWDTGQPSAQPLTPSAFTEKRGWTQIPPQKTDASFTGDVVMSSGRLLAVMRKQDSGVELYSTGVAGVVARLRLLLLGPGGEPAVRLERVSLVENTKGAACLEAFFKAAKGTEIAAKFRLKRGEISLQAEPGAGANQLRIDCPGRSVVLPDFFADDIVIDAGKVPLPAVEVPSENFLLHLTGKSDAIAMCVFENRQQDVKVTLSGTGKDRMITGSEIGFEGKRIWVGLLEAPQIWHERDLKADDTGKLIPLDWKMPFPAQWRVDFTKTNELTDSWEMLLQEKEGAGYVKPSWLGSGEDHLGPNRRRWNTVLGEYPYPCWSDYQRQGYLQPLKNRALQFQGPVVVYPINRVKETPLNAYTVVDIMRNTLGVGPCEHILDLEGQKAEYKGRATCGVRDALGAIYGQKQQKQRHDEVEQILNDGLVFVTHIRGRITRYVDFGHKMRQYLAEQKKTHPELSDSLTEMDKIAQEIDARVAARADKIQTPAYVAKMNEDFRKNVMDYEGADALQKCKKYTAALVVIGDNQDELSGECRWVVKTLRQRAGMLMALDPKAAPVAAEVRARTQEALRNPANHEGPRH